MVCASYIQDSLKGVSDLSVVNMCATKQIEWRELLAQGSCGSL